LKASAPLCLAFGPSQDHSKQHKRSADGGDDDNGFGRHWALPLMILRIIIIGALEPTLT
jgi:hypothetical protein